MKSYYQQEKEYTRGIIDQQLRELSDHKIEILHDRGGYKHLFAVNRDQQFPTLNAFHVYATPNIITIHYSDRRAWTIQETLRLIDEPKPEYWAPVIMNPGGKEHAYWSIPEITKAWVHEWIEGYFDDNFDMDDESSAFWPDIWFDIEKETRYLWKSDDECIRRELLRLEYEWHGETHRPFTEEDLDDYLWRVPTPEWLRVCAALSWTAQTYYGRKQTKENKQ